MAGILQTLWNVIRNAEQAEKPSADLAEESRRANEERRVVERFTGPLPATISAGLSSFPEPVTLRDLNEKGVYLYSSTAFPRGATVEILAELPSQLSMYGKRRVHYTASVLRCEENAAEGKYGIAATIKKCEVLPARECSEQPSTPTAAPEASKSPARKSANERDKLHVKDSAHVRE